jgi:uncharacterized membrane protein YidH (DUF202 family)
MKMKRRRIYRKVASVIIALSVVLMIVAVMVG